ncbi:hypothetical protein D3C76_1421890 [compost metagenome]
MITSRIPIPSEARPKIEGIEERIRSGNRWLSTAPSTPPSSTAPALMNGPITTVNSCYLLIDIALLLLFSVSNRQVNPIFCIMIPSCAPWRKVTLLREFSPLRYEAANAQTLSRSNGWPYRHILFYAHHAVRVTQAHCRTTVKPDAFCFY